MNYRFVPKVRSIPSNSVDEWPFSVAPATGLRSYRKRLRTPETVFRLLVHYSSVRRFAQSALWPPRLSCRQPAAVRSQPHSFWRSTTSPSLTNNRLPIRFSFLRAQHCSAIIRSLFAKRFGPLRTVFGLHSSCFGIVLTTSVRLVRQAFLRFAHIQVLRALPVVRIYSKRRLIN